MTGPNAAPRRPTALVLGLWLVLLLAGIAWIARTSFTADLSAFLPADPDAQQRVLIEQLQDGATSRTLMVGIDGGEAPARAEASRALAAALRATGLFEQVHNGEQGAWEATGTWLFEHRYQLSPAVGPERFTPEGLREAIDETVSLLGTPAGNLIKPLLERDPTGETQRIAEALIPAQSPRMEDGVWVARERPRALLLLGTKAAGSDLDGQAQAIAAVQRAFAPQAARGLTLRLSGPGVFAVESRASIEREVKQLALVGSLVMSGLLLLAFASVRALFVAMLPVVTGIVGGIAAVSLVFGKVHGITLGFGSTLIGEAVDYAIYYLIQARGAVTAGAAPGTGWQRWRDDNWATVRLGVLTSVGGFAALVFSGFPGLAQLGVFSIAGLASAALATRFVLPVLMPDGAAGQGLRRPLARFAGVVVRGLPRVRLPLALLAVMTLGFVALQGKALWRGDLASLSPVSVSALALDAELRHEIGASDAGTLVVVHGRDAEGALQAAEHAGRRLDALVEAGVLAGYESPARWLPSQATQAARLASLPEAAALRRDLALAAEGGPLKAERLAPFLAAVEAARQGRPLDRAALEGKALAPLVDALLMPRPDGRWSALIALQPAAAATAATPASTSASAPAAAPAASTGPLPGVSAAAVGVAPRVRAALQGLEGAQVIDIKQELDGLYARYLREALWQAVLGALAVVALLGASLRSGRRLLAVCLPLAVAVLLTMGGLALAGVALGILHLVGLLLVVAVGSNYALFFDQLHRQGPVDDDTLASLMLANLTTVVSFGLIALSGIPALSAIGRVVAPGALLAMLLSAAFAARPRRDVRAPSS